jgi:hypothetical protein
LVTTERIRKISPTLRNDVRLENYVCGEPHRDISSVAGLRHP